MSKTEGIGVLLSIVGTATMLYYLWIRNFETAATGAIILIVGVFFARTIFEKKD